MNSLIDRYLAVALESIPDGQRLDVRTEIRGAIGEMVEQRVEEGEPEEVAVRAALNELGDPAKLAASYSDRQQYLIGPGWYPSYIKALKVVSSVVLPIVAVISMVETLGGDGSGVIDAVIDAAGSVIWAAAWILFWTTVGFVIADRTGDVNSLPQGRREWSVDDLLKAEGPRRITLVDVVPSVIALVAFGALGVLQSSRGAGLFLRGDFADDYQHLPVINPDLGIAWVIGFFGLLAISIAVEVVKYIVGWWTRRVLLLVVAEAVLWIAYVGILAASEQIFNPELVQQFDETDAEWWVAGGPANSITALIIIAISVWEVWEGWQENRKYEQARLGADVPS